MIGRRWVGWVLAAVVLLPMATEAGPPSRFRHRDPVIKPLDKSSAEERLQAIRNYDAGVDLILMFEMVERRRKDDARRIGILETTRVAGLPIMRLSEIDPVDGDDGNDDGYIVRGEWRIRGGESARVEFAEPGAGNVFRELERSRWTEPLVDGFSHTPFDLVMPYLYWQEYYYEGPERVNGRSSHLFRFEPPEAWEAILATKGIVSVRVVLDRQFNAPLLIEYLGADENVVRSLRAVSFREVDETWVVGTLEARDYDADLRTRLVMLGGGVVPSTLMAVGSAPRDRIRLPFTELSLEWF